MCGVCGCGSEHAHDHAHHHHGHDHAHHHHHHPGEEPRRVRIEAELLAKNDRLAAQNRAWLDDRGIVAIDVMGTPGAGKTALLEGTLRRIGVPAAVLEGDQDTERDAERIRATGCRALQITTGAGCHLDAAMVARALGELAPAPRSLLFIENVGNLVCPALFPLGEHARVVVMSVTEGDDKPLKYPHMFRAADVLVLNKVDLLPHVDFDVERCLERARGLRPGLRVFEVSATRGAGMDAWCAWLCAQLDAPEGR